jgi:hypothetical protein
MIKRVATTSKRWKNHWVKAMMEMQKRATTWKKVEVHVSG